MTNDTLHPFTNYHYPCFKMGYQGTETISVHYLMSMNVLLGDIRRPPSLSELTLGLTHLGSEVFICLSKMERLDKPCDHL